MQGDFFIDKKIILTSNVPLKSLSFGHISIWALETVLGHWRTGGFKKCNCFQDSSEQLDGRFGGRHISSYNPTFVTHSLCFGINASA